MRGNSYHVAEIITKRLKPLVRLFSKENTLLQQYFSALFSFFAYTTQQSNWYIAIPQEINRVMATIFPCLICIFNQHCHTFIKISLKRLNVKRKRILKQYLKTKSHTQL